jgi:hypothetical protein
MKKEYMLKPSEIKRLVPEIGFVLVTDKITVEGNKVDYMVRETPDRDGDSGWIFYGGGETQEYIDDPNNTSLLSANTVANYDPEVIEYLTYPSGTEIERNKEGLLQVISKDVKKPDVIFFYPVDEGYIQVSTSWGFSIAHHMLRRFDKGSLVIWRPGFTIWLEAYNSSDKSAEESISEMINKASPSKEKFEKLEMNGLHKARYYLEEETAGKVQTSAYILGFTENEGVHLAIYYDDAKHVSEIDEIWSTLKYEGT